MEIFCLCVCLCVTNFQSNPYLSCFKSEFEAVMGKLGLLIELIKTSIPQPVYVPPSVSVPPVWYLRCFKSDFHAVKSKVGLLIKYI